MFIFYIFLNLYLYKSLHKIIKIKLFNMQISSIIKRKGTAEMLITANSQ